MLTSINIPNSVTSIGQGAFADCDILSSITIPNSVTSIGEEAFAFCQSLTSITIPNSITSIGRNTFVFCRWLTSITIPNSVTSIGNYAFNSCPQLYGIVFERTKCPTISSNAFSSNAVIIVPKGSKASYEAAFSGYSYLIIEKEKAKALLDNLIATATQEIAAYAECYNGVNPSDRYAYEKQLANAQNVSANSIDELEQTIAYKSLDM